MNGCSSAAWQRLLAILTDALTSPERYRALYHTDFAYAEQAVRLFSEWKDAASLGDLEARNALIDYFVQILESNVDGQVQEDIQTLVDFQNIINNGAGILFELLLANRSLCSLLDRYAITEQLDESRLFTIAQREEEEKPFSVRYQSRREQFRFLAALLYAATYGQDCIDSLQYQDISEIGILNKDYIYVVHKGRKIRLSFLRFDTSGTIVNIQKKATQNAALNYDRQNPILVTAKNNASRISAAGYDVTPTDQDWYYNERIFHLQSISLETMLQTLHTIDETIYWLLMMNQKGRGSFFVTGSDMGVGKSTFLLSLLEKYPNYWGIGILDPQNELQAGKKYPDKNVLTLVENARKDLSSCFAYLLKTSRDVIVVSEITMPEEVTELVHAALRLNAGVCATMHSFSPHEVVPNLRNLMLRTEMYQNKTTAEEDIAGSIDLIIHLCRLAGGRIVVESIHEIYLERELERPDWNDEREEDKEYIQWKLMKLQWRALQEQVTGRKYLLRKLVEYQPAADCWIVWNRPSEQYFSKMSRYAEPCLLDQVKSRFPLSRTGDLSK